MYPSILRMDSMALLCRCNSVLLIIPYLKSKSGGTHPLKAMTYIENAPVSGPRPPTRDGRLCTQSLYARVVPSRKLLLSPNSSVSYSDIPVRVV